MFVASKSDQGTMKIKIRDIYLLILIINAVRISLGSFVLFRGIKSIIQIPALIYVVAMPFLAWHIYLDAQKDKDISFRYAFYSFLIPSLLYFFIVWMYIGATGDLWCFDSWYDYVMICTENI